MVFFFAFHLCCRNNSLLTTIFAFFTIIVYWKIMYIPFWGFNFFFPYIGLPLIKVFSLFQIYISTFLEILFNLRGFGLSQIEKGRKGKNHKNKTNHCLPLQDPGPHHLHHIVCTRYIITMSNIVHAYVEHYIIKTDRAIFHILFY